MTEPQHGVTYGELDNSLTWSCGYMTGPTVPACLTPATWHGIVWPALESEPTWSTACCDQPEHHYAMRLVADYVHEMASPCGLPGSRFYPDENECRMPDDEVGRLSAATLAVVR